MRNLLLVFYCCLGFSQLATAQIYLEQFEAGSEAYFMSTSDAYTTSVMDSELTITGDGSANPFTILFYDLNDENGLTTLDMTGNNKIFVRAKASSIGTELRMDVIDAAGFTTTLNSVSKVLTNEFVTLEYDYSGVYSDGGFGGTPCTDSPPCPVDGTMAARLGFFIDASAGGFNGDVVIDFIAFDTSPDEEAMSDIFQDHFDTDSSLTSMTTVPAGYTSSLVNGTEIQLSGDGTAGMWDPFAYIFRSVPAYEEIDLDFTEGNNKLFVKMKSSVPGTVIRFDLQDIDGFVTTQGSLQKILDTEYQVYEFDFTGVYGDLGFGGTSCTEETAPCPVNAERISSMVIFVEPGVGMFAGDVTIDYISVGTSLEPPGNEPELVYEDRFNNETIEWTGDGNGYTVAETGSDWIISGDGSAGPFATVSYILHDKESGEPIVLDITPAQSRMFLEMRTNSGNEPVRIDLIDSSGYVSNQTSLTKIVSGEDAVYEYNFDGILLDGGFGGSPCDAEDAPCALDPTAITQVLIYIRAADGGFDGDLIIDYLSFGQSLGDDPITSPTGVLNYVDEIDPDTDLFLGDAPGGFTVDIVDGAIQMVGDGSSGMFAAQFYTLHDDIGMPIIADAAASGDTVFVRARATDPLDLRVDLVDNAGFATTIGGVTNAINSSDYATYAYVFTGAYQDGGFGGTSCDSDTAPCAVDAQRIAEMSFYPAPTTGAYTGTIDIDWISFGRTMTVSVPEVPEVEELRLYPNPVQNQLALEYNLLESGQVGWQIFDGLGRRVLTQQAVFKPAGDQFDRIDLHELSRGVYHLQLNFNGRVVRAMTIQKI